jgi:RNA polymerase sigma factor (sigma-70 family)
MVPTAPPSHAGEAQVEYHWLSKLARWLELGRKKVAILIEGASVGGLRPLVSMLLEHAAPPVICFHAPELLDVPNDSLVVLTVHESELRWLNLNRPLVANKRLRLLLWLEFPLHRLRGGAPDFFDWISHVVRCPKRPPRFAVQALLDARAANQPVTWRGRDLHAALDRAALGLVRLEASGQFASLVAAVEKVEREVPVWTAARDPWHSLRIELAMQHTGRQWWIVEHPGFNDIRHAVVSDEVLSWEAATERLGGAETTAQRSALACVAALLEGEPEQVEHTARALADGRPLDELIVALRRASVPGAMMVERDTAYEGSWSIGVPGLVPSPAHVHLVQLHAAALRNERSPAWVMAADCARAVGHADVAQHFGEHAISTARTARHHQRATLVLAVASHEAGDGMGASEGFHRLLESLASAPAGDLLRALALTEQAAVLADEGHHVDAVADAGEAVDAWECCNRRLLSRPHLEALRLQGRCLAKLGDEAAVRSWTAERSAHWPAGNEGELQLELAWARGGDREALERLACRFDRRTSGTELVAIGLDLAELRLEQEGVRAAVTTCLQVLRALRAIHGTDLHPRGIDARLLIGTALHELDPMRASAFLRRALTDCESIYGATPHRRTLRVVVRLAEVDRQRGDLASATVLAARAGAIQGEMWFGAGVTPERPREPSANASTPRDADEATTMPTSEVAGARSLLQDVVAPDTGLTPSSETLSLHRDFHVRDALVTQSASALRRFFLARGVHKTDVDDLVQRTLLGFLERIRVPQAELSSPWAYLFGIASRKLASHRRHEARQIDWLHGSDDLIASPLLALDESQAAVEALRRLPDVEQRLLRLRYFEGLSGVEIARLLGTSEASVRGRLRRAIMLLRQSFGR